MSSADPNAITDERLAPPRTARAGWVYLVGAGPGDPGLLTLRGAELLGSADVIVHSEPLAPELRARCRPEAELHSVGPRGRPRADADAHHQAVADQLCEAARAGRSVVRLHGGDPLFFSRGLAVAQALARAEVPFEIVPGVASPLACAAYAGVPLSWPGLGERVMFVRAGDDAEIDWPSLGAAGGTLCVLMAERELGAVTRALQEQVGLDRRAPAALVVVASLPEQRTVTAELGELAERAASLGPLGPALLVVGPGAALGSELGWFERLPLFGQRILVLRPAHQAGATVAQLRARGARAITLPAIAIAPPPDPLPLERAVAGLGRYDVVAFSSVNGVAGLWRELDRQRLDARAFGRAAVAAIGPSTATALAERGVRADIVPARFVAEELGAAILGHLGAAAPTAQVLLPRALVARDTLVELLAAAGAQVDVAPAYQTVAGYGDDEASALRAELAAGGIDWIMLTASSTVRELAAMLGPAARELLGRTRLASIGPVTTAAAESEGHRVAVTAARSTIEGLIDAMEAAHRSERP